MTDRRSRTSQRAPEPKTPLDEAVDVGARAWFTSRQLARRDDSRLDPKTRQPWTWDDVNELDQHGYRALVRPIARAVVEHLKAGGA